MVLTTTDRCHRRCPPSQDILFILHAEHEMNCSTAAVRHLSSSGVDVYTAMAGAVGALYGPLHGGANEAVLRMLARIGKVWTTVWGVEDADIRRGCGRIARVDAARVNSVDTVWIQCPTVVSVAATPSLC